MSFPSQIKPPMWAVTPGMVDPEWGWFWQRLVFGVILWEGQGNPRIYGSSITADTFFTMTVDSGSGEYVGGTRGLTMDFPVTSAGTIAITNKTLVLGLDDPDRVTYFASVLIPTGSGRKDILGSNDVSGVPAWELDITNTRMNIIIPGVFVYQSSDGVYTAGAHATMGYSRNGSGSGNHTGYVNGALVGIATDATNSYLDSAAERLLGQRVNGTQAFDTGQIDCVYILDGDIGASCHLKLAIDPSGPFRMAEEARVVYDLVAAAAVPTIPLTMAPYIPAGPLQ